MRNDITVKGHAKLRAPTNAEGYLRGHPPENGCIFSFAQRIIYKVRTRITSCSELFLRYCVCVSGSPDWRLPRVHCWRSPVKTPAFHPLSRLLRLRCLADPPQSLLPFLQRPWHWL